jgi:hypothetical protein
MIRDLLGFSATIGIDRSIRYPLAGAFNINVIEKNRHGEEAPNAHVTRRRERQASRSSAHA